nr:immunoglobulin heavy chain junction region [Macaca mulatta]
CTRGPVDAADIDFDFDYW